MEFNINVIFHGSIACEVKLSNTTKKHNGPSKMWKKKPLTEFMCHSYK